MRCAVDIALALLAVYPILAAQCASDPFRLTVTSTKHQLQEYADVICEGAKDPSDEWFVMSNTSTGTMLECGQDWGLMIGEVCRIEPLETMHNGVYWCESEEGRVASVLFSLAYRAMPGADLTLVCESAKRSDVLYQFYKGDKMIAQQPTARMLISDFSARHEGVYRCGAQGHQPSPGVRVSLKERQSSSKEQSSADGTVQPNAWDSLYKYIFLLISITIVGFYALCMWIVFTICVCFLYDTRTPRGRGMEHKHV